MPGKNRGPQIRRSALPCCNPEEAAQSNQGGPLGHGMGGPFAPGSVFDLENIPVVTKTWAPNEQTSVALLGSDWLYPASPGYWMTTTVGNALDLYMAGGLGGGSLSWWGTRIKSFFTGFSLKSARLPGETVNQCVNRVQDALLGSAGTKVLAGITLGTFMPAAGTISVGTVIKGVPEAGTNLIRMTKVPAQPILEGVAPSLATATGVAFGASWGLELGFWGACR